MLVRLRCCRATATGVQKRGSIVELSDAEAQKLLCSGRAEAPDARDKRDKVHRRPPRRPAPTVTAPDEARTPPPIAREATPAAVTDSVLDLALPAKTIELLTAAGWHTVDQVPRDRRTLVDADGIGNATAAAILEAIGE